MDVDGWVGDDDLCSEVVRCTRIPRGVLQQPSEGDKEREREEMGDGQEVEEKRGDRWEEGNDIHIFGAWSPSFWQFPEDPM